MKRLLSAVFVTVLASTPIFAQAPPAGWKMRVDRSTNAADPDAAGAIKFVAMGNGFHATNPQAAVYFNPANTAAGNYTLKGNFVLQKPSNHTNYYGLVLGGAELEGAGQNYIYFMIAQDGTWMVKHRAGADTHDVAKGPSDAVKKPDATGKSTNALEVRVAAAKIDYVVNGTVVHSTPKSGMTAKTDGVYGIRINHQLEVHVDGLSVAKM
jgi:hypothetical protein